MELPVCTASEAFYIVGVRYPIRRAHIALKSHIVHVLVNIQEFANLTVYFCRLRLAQSCRQPLELRPCLIVAHLLIILVVAQVELVHIVEINAVVTIGKVLVVALTNIEHSVVQAVQEDVSRLIVLTINIESALQHNHLDGWVFRASISIVTTITNLPATVFVVSL